MSFGAKLLLSLLTVVSCVLSQPRLALAAPVSISPEELAAQTAAREDRVPEFNFIRETATKLGLRVWLFGGTASGYLHYVKWDMQRERGDGRFQADRFDYDFTNIYRSTQDLDIVADGPQEKITELARALSDQYPHFLGNKAGWEVRSLRESRGTPGSVGYKEALLNDFDFLNQDTDSNSTGMIEITRAHGEAVVRDLREWNQTGINHFLKDSSEDKDTFYRSMTHFQTARARAGQNPEIFSVIRALTKAFQYELSFSKEDWRQLQEIVDQFRPATVQDANAQRRLKDMGKKLFKNAVNLEYAWNTLEKMGLRQKLMQFDEKGELDSLAWWMNKEPLRTKPVGEGFGKTAQQLGLDVVAHETNNFLAYESITRAHTGDANVLISRENAADEMALHGDGFYTLAGRQGARGTGLTIRFHLAPGAREGTDFVLKNNIVIVKNKAALKVIQESLQLTPLEYFAALVEGKMLSRDDRGIIEKLKRRMKVIERNLSQADIEQIEQIVLSGKNANAELEFFQILLSRGDLERVFDFLNKAKSSGGDLWKFYFAQIDKEPALAVNFLADIDSFEAMSEKGVFTELIKKNLIRLLLKSGRYERALQVIEKIADVEMRDRLFLGYFEFSKEDPHALTDALKRIERIEKVAEASTNSYVRIEWTRLLILNGEWRKALNIIENEPHYTRIPALTYYFQYINDHAKSLSPDDIERIGRLCDGELFPQYLHLLILRGLSVKGIFQFLFAERNSRKPGLNKTAIQGEALRAINQMPSPGKSEMAEISQLVQKSLEENLALYAKDPSSFGQREASMPVVAWLSWNKRPAHSELLHQLFSSNSYILICNIFAMTQFDLANPAQLEVLKETARHEGLNHLAMVALINADWWLHPEILRTIAMRGIEPSNTLLLSVLVSDKSKAYPEFFEIYVRSQPGITSDYLDTLLKAYQWKDNKGLRRLLPWYQKMNGKNLLAALRAGKTLLNQVPQDPSLRLHVLPASTYFKEQNVKMFEQEYGRHYLSRMLERLDQLKSISAAEMAQIANLIRQDIAADRMSSVPLWLSWKKSAEYPDILQTLARGSLTDLVMLAKYATLDPRNEQHVAALKKVLESTTRQDAVVQQLAKDVDGWSLHPEIMLGVIEKSPSRETISWNEQYRQEYKKNIFKVLAKKEWANHPEILEAYIRFLPSAQRTKESLGKDQQLQQLLDLPQWKNHPQLKSAIPWFQRPVTAQNIMKAFVSEKAIPAPRLRCEGLFL